MNTLLNTRLHTPAEVLKRNRVTRWEVVRDVVLQQIHPDRGRSAVVFRMRRRLLGERSTMWPCGHSDCGLPRRPSHHCWLLLEWMRLALPRSVSQSGHTILAGALAGGSYPSATQSHDSENGAEVLAPAFMGWELAVAGFIYWYFVPALQFMLAVSIVDTWQYFLHRAMHLNRWLYGGFKSFEGYYLSLI